jgi:hypothetical protein
MIYSRLLPRLTALGLLFMLFLAAGWLTSLFLSHLAQRSQDIDIQRRTLGRLEALIAQSGEIDRLLDAARSRQTGTAFFSAPSTPLLMAQLQQRLQSIVTARKAQFLRATEIPPAEREEITFVGIRLEITGTVQGLAQIVGSIESAMPFLFIDRALFTPDLSRGPDPQRPPTVALSVDVLAAVLGPPAVQPGKAN